MKIFTALFLIIFSESIYAEVPQEIQGVWIPDIDKTIALMEKNMDEVDSSFMRERYLPKLKRTITENQYIHVTGSREFMSDISLQEKQGSNFVMVLSSSSTPEIQVTFIPQENGMYIMQSNNPASGNLVWKRP